MGLHCLSLFSLFKSLHAFDSLSNESKAKFFLKHKQLKNALKYETQNSGVLKPLCSEGFLPVIT